MNRILRFLKIETSKRIFGLDLFRAIAILIVVKSHGALVSYGILDSLPTLPLVDGVELFFVLSGFLIGGILLKQIESEKGFGFSSLFHFWKRRWFRTIPNYYLVLLINILLVNYGVINGDIEQFSMAFFLFLQNFSTGFVDFFWESWSLSVEEWFYIFLPICFLIFRLFFQRQQAILATILLLIIVPIAYRVSISGMNVNGFWLDVHFRKVVLTRLDAIIYGVLAAYIHFYHTEFFKKYRNVFFILGLALIYFNLYFPKEPNDFYTKVISYSLTSIGAAFLLPKAFSVKTFRFPIFGKVITVISVISYSMYLVNLSLVAQVLVKNFVPDSTVDKVLSYGAFWFFTLLISLILYRFFEKPIMDLRDK